MNGLPTSAPKRVALLGGSFNPVHIGHLHIAEVVLATGEYEEVVFIPTYVPSHKSSVALAAGAHRIEMLRLATASYDRFVVSDIEVRRGGVSYTIDTVRELEREGALVGRPGLVVGDDLGDELDTWRDAGTLFSMVELLVAQRRSQRVPLSLSHRYLDNHLIPLSSSQLRERVRARKVIRFLVPDVVDAYIRQHKLYGGSDD